MPWGSIAASVIGGVLSDDSADSAASAQQQATDQATAEQRRQYDTTRADLAPYRRAGNDAVGRLSHLLGLGQPRDETRYGLEDFKDYNLRNAPQGYSPASSDADAQKQFNDYSTGAPESFGPEQFKQFGFRELGATPQPGQEFGALNKKFTLADFWDDPVTKASYQFGLETGEKALGNMAGARGNRNSGAQLKALTKFATDYTGGQAAGSQARFVGDQDRTFNRLSGVAGTGQTATTTGAMLGQNMANTVSGLMGAQGNARGAAAIAGGNAMGGAVQNVGNTLSNWWARQQNPGGVINNYNASGMFQPYYAMSSDNYG